MLECQLSSDEIQVRFFSAGKVISLFFRRDTSSYLKTWRGFPQMSETEIGRDVRYVTICTFALGYSVCDLSLETTVCETTVPEYYSTRLTLWRPDFQARA